MSERAGVDDPRGEQLAVAALLRVAASPQRTGSVHGERHALVSTDLRAECLFSRMKAAAWEEQAENGTWGKARIFF